MEELNEIRLAIKHYRIAIEKKAKREGLATDLKNMTQEAQQRLADEWIKYPSETSFLKTMEF